MKNKSIYLTLKKHRRNYQKWLAEGWMAGVSTGGGRLLDIYILT